MGDTFKRENRFIVIKRKHLVADQEERIHDLLDELGVLTSECVVVESDWPEYETVWRMIEARVTGSRPTPVGVSELADEMALKVTAWFHGRKNAEPNLAYFVANNRSAIDAALRSMPEEGGEGA